MVKIVGILYNLIIKAMRVFSQLYFLYDAIICSVTKVRFGKADGLVYIEMYVSDSVSYQLNMFYNNSLKLSMYKFDNMTRTTLWEIY